MGKKYNKNGDTKAFRRTKDHEHHFGTPHLRGNERGMTGKDASGYQCTKVYLKPLSAVPTGMARVHRNKLFNPRKGKPSAKK